MLTLFASFAILVIAFGIMRSQFLLQNKMKPAESNLSYFCQQCAPLTRTLTFDPGAEPRAELMSGSCMWKDELHPDWCVECVWKLRALFHLRYRLTLGETVSIEKVEEFHRIEDLFPTWPFFRPERRSPDLRELVKRLLHRNSRRACVEFERLDRQLRDQQNPFF